MEDKTGSFVLRGRAVEGLDLRKNTWIEAK